MKTVKLSDFIEGAGISMTARATDRNPHMEGSRDMDNWRVTLRAGRSRMSLYFSKGRGHNGQPPTVEEVLSCLASDAAGVENSEGPNDWSNEYGYGNEPVKALRIYKATVSQSARLQNLLGQSAYETLLWETEQL